MQPTQTPAMQDCIDACIRCHRTCLHEAMTHCLEAGGEHVEPDHFRLMLDCADICRTSADFMLRSSALHGLTCGVCAQVCERCADSCDAIDGMQACAATCRTCAEHCRAMTTAH